MWPTPFMFSFVAFSVSNLQGHFRVKQFGLRKWKAPVGIVEYCFCRRVMERFAVWGSAHGLSELFIMEEKWCYYRVTISQYIATLVWRVLGMVGPKNTCCV